MIAWFVSAHGFGHAARACAVIEALWRRDPALRCELFTAAPAWFFADSLGRAPGTGFGYHEATVDVGLVQTDALHEDLPATVAALRRWLPFDPQQVAELAAVVTSLGCRLVVCDVSPLGLAVAERAGLPSVLIENFTWEWIYRAYADDAPELGRIADELAAHTATAVVRIQTEPYCAAAPGAHRVPPVSRRPRTDRAVTREQLGIPADAAAVMVTMGGIEWSYAELDGRLAQATDGPWLIIPGGSPHPQRRGRAVRLPHRSAFYHPDLIQAADAVLGKLGYSTLAEVHRAGLPLGYVPRQHFPESPRLEAWVKTHLPNHRIPPDRFTAGEWLDDLPALLALPRQPPAETDGAAEVAGILLEILPRRPASVLPLPRRDTLA